MTHFADVPNRHPFFLAASGEVTKGVLYLVKDRVGECGDPETGTALPHFMVRTLEGYYDFRPTGDPAVVCAALQSVVLIPLMAAYEISGVKQLKPHEPTEPFTLDFWAEDDAAAIAKLPSLQGPNEGWGDMALVRVLAADHAVPIEIPNLGP